MTELRRLAPLALIVLSLVPAACGGDGDRDRGGVARLDGRDGTSQTAGSQDPEEAMLAYAECMRRNGVDMPDPEGGAFVITPQTQDRSREGRRKFEGADRKCRPHLKNLRPPKLSDEEKANMREAALKHTRCMREHGIDLPDPQFEGGGAAIPLDSVDLDDPKFQAAQKACEKHLRAVERQADGQ